jgi:hypothetical protein
MNMVSFYTNFQNFDKIRELYGFKIKLILIFYKNIFTFNSFL